MPHSLRDVVRQLGAPSCAPARATTARCFWIGGAGAGEREREAGRRGRHPGRRSLAVEDADVAAARRLDPSLLRTGDGGGGRMEPHATDAPASAGLGSPPASGVHLLQLLRCMRYDASLPLAIVPEPLHAQYGALDAGGSTGGEPGPAARDALRRLVARYEGQVLALATALLVSGGKAHAAALREAPVTGPDGEGRARAPPRAEPPLVLELPSTKLPLTKRPSTKRPLTPLVLELPLTKLPSTKLPSTKLPSTPLVLELPSERLSPRATDAAWTAVLVEVLGLHDTT